VKTLGKAFRGVLRRLVRSERGAAAAEFALVAVVLVYMFANLIDIGLYVYEKVELQNAGQALMEKIFNACPPNGSDTPITTACASASPTVISSTIENSAVQSTTLGTHVTLHTISATNCPITGYNTNTLNLCEGWFCVLTGGALNTGTAITSAQPTCTNGNKAGDYVAATVTYTYAPVFPHLTVASLLHTPITYKAWMRVN
jgi:Flp pilus assembly protein TadG